MAHTFHCGQSECIIAPKVYKTTFNPCTYINIYGISFKVLWLYKMIKYIIKARLWPACLLFICIFSLILRQSQAIGPETGLHQPIRDRHWEPRPIRGQIAIRCAAHQAQWSTNSLNWLLARFFFTNTSSCHGPSRTHVYYFFCTSFHIIHPCTYNFCWFQLFHFAWQYIQLGYPPFRYLAQTRQTLPGPSIPFWPDKVQFVRRAGGLWGMQGRGLLLIYLPFLVIIITAEL